MKLCETLRSNWYKIFNSILTYFAFAGAGAAVTAVGSGLLDLKIRANTDFKTISYLVPARSIGHILGSTLTGVLESRININLLLSIANLLAGISVISGPYLTNVWLMAPFFLIAGIGHGMIEAFSSILLVKIWKNKCTNWLQAFHMAYGVGALLSPIVTRSFLLPTTEEDEDNFALPKNLTELETDNPSTIFYSSDDVEVQYAFTIFGTWALALVVPFFLCYTREKNEQNKEKVAKSNNEEPVVLPNRRKIYGAVALAAISTHTIYGVEVLVGTLGASFSVKSALHMPKQTGVLLATVFWSCFSFYRLVFIPLTFVMKEKYLLIFNLIIMGLSVFITVPWGGYSQPFIWSGFILMGLGISPIFAIIYGMMGRYFPLTGRLSSIIINSGIIGESIHPAIVAALMTYNPILFIYYLGTLALICVIATFTLIYYCRVMFPKVPTAGTEKAKLGKTISIIDTSSKV